MRDAFRREIFEEIGINTDASNAVALDIVFWRQDKPEKNWHDRAFAHVYMNKLALNFHDFHFQESEVAGIVRINARECLDLLKGDTPGVRATKITQNGETEVDITIHDFLVAPNEIAIVKYGLVLQSVIQMFDK